MYDLIRKDFLVQKNIFLFGLLYTVFGAFVFEEMVPGGGALYMVVPYATIYLLVMYACGYDAKNNAEVILNSLPVTRVEIVIAKYLSALAFMAVGILFAIMIGTIGFYTGFPKIERLVSFNDMIVVFISGMVFVSIFYPLYFKFGLEKMRMVNIVLFMLLFFAPNLITSIVAENPDNGIVRAILTFLNDTPSWLLKACSLFAGIIFYLLSLFVSIKVYRNKEF
jgi:ABC-2 type transport system permease protein